MELFTWQTECEFETYLYKQQNKNGIVWDNQNDEQTRSFLNGPAVETEMYQEVNAQPEFVAQEIVEIDKYNNILMNALSLQISHTQVYSIFWTNFMEQQKN